MEISKPFVNVYFLKKNLAYRKIKFCTKVLVFPWLQCFIVPLVLLCTIHTRCPVKEKLKLGYVWVSIPSINLSTGGTLEQGWKDIEDVGVAERNTIQKTGLRRQYCSLKSYTTCKCSEHCPSQRKCSVVIQQSLNPTYFTRRSACDGSLGKPVCLRGTVQSSAEILLSVPVPVHL